MIPNSGWLAIFTAKTWAGFGAWPRAWRAEWSASTPACFRQRSRPLAASNNQALAEKDRVMAWTNFWRLNISALAAFNRPQRERSEVQAITSRLDSTPSRLLPGIGFQRRIS